MGDGNNEPPKEEHVHAVSISMKVYAVIQTITFCVPLLPVLAELGSYVWLITSVPSIPFILWDWIGPAGMWIFFLPLIGIGIAYTYIVFCVLIATAWIHRWNRQCPPEEGYFSRKYTAKGLADHRIEYYHKRGFIIKWPMWVASKSPFPWLVNWCLRRNDNDLGKNVIFDNSFVPLELCDMEDNVYFGPGSAGSAHTVNAIFGDLFIGRVKIGKNAVIGSNSVIGPGAVTLPNTTFLPNTLINSRWKDKWGTLYYVGTSARPVVPEYSGTHAPQKGKQEKDSK
jgi:hypothetical protein